MLTRLRGEKGFGLLELLMAMTMLSIGLLALVAAFNSGTIALEGAGRPAPAEDLAPHLREGQTLMFAHGFNIHFNQILPPPFVDVSMVAPKSPGHLLRRQFNEGNGVP